MKIKKVLVFLLVITFTILLVSCGDKTDDGGKNNTDKTIPVYQGMVVSKELSTVKTGISYSLMSATIDDRDDIDQDDPYDNFDGSTIEDEIKNELEVITSDEVEYFVEKDTYFYITIKLSNPDNFEILSFTLNGKFYQSYQFEYGSDSENLILKANSGEVAGIKDYTINTIKYSDRTEIKDVIFAGDRTVKVGVTYDNLPYARTTNLNIETNSISFNAEIADTNKLIELYDSPLKVFLYDGEEIVDYKDLEVGNNEVSFTKLKQDTLYQYALVTSYDALDGNGHVMVVLEKYAFYTNKMLMFGEVTPSQESISFELIIDDKENLGEIRSIKLYQEDELVKELEDLDLREFTNLLSNNEYELRVTYTYDLNDGAGVQTVVATHTVTTLTKATPTVAIVEVVETQEEISFELDVEDTDQVGEVTAIELFKDNELVKELEDLDLREFTNLLSNNEYELRVTYTYDLNDGAGVQTVVATHTVTTLTKATPTVAIVEVVATQDSISFELDVVDTDQVGEVTAIELFKDNELVKELEDLDLREFTNLLSNNEYELRVTYTYDLNDGAGVQTVVATHTVTTLTKATPTVEIVDVIETQEEITFDFDILDVDSVGEVTAIELFKDNELVKELEDLDLREFTNLLSNNEYELRVTYTYDLNDGAGVQTVVATHTVTTLTKATPTVAIVEVVATQDSISFELDVVDTDQVGEVTSIKLYKDNELVKELEDLDLREFTELLSNNLYEIRVTYTYDLNDGKGETNKVFKKDILTYAIPLEITHLEILNTVNPKTGEEVHVRISYINPSKLKITSFYVNDEKIDVITSGDTTNSILKFIPTFDGGIYNVSITAIDYESFGVIKHMEVSSNYEDDILIMSSLGIESINEENGHDYIAIDGDNYIIINLNNPTGYSIKNVVLNIGNYDQNEIEVISQNQIRLKIKDYISKYNRISITSITYGMEGYEYTTKTISGVDVILYGVNSKEIRYISTIEELQNLENGYVYELTKDIDARGFKWIPYEFSGVIYGNGYQISNLSVVIENESQDQQYYGLFSKLNSGYIDSLGITNAYISIKTKGFVRVGGLVGYSSFSITNSYVSDTIIIVTSDSRPDVGGLVGRTDSFSITNSYVSGTTITVTSNSYAQVGGLVGENYSYSITNSYVSGTTITVTADLNVDVGGLVGTSDWSSITNSYVSGTTITVTSSSPKVGGLVGLSRSSSITNSYVSFDTIIQVNEEKKEINDDLIYLDDLNNKSFYTDILGWDENIWNLDNLDYESGKYPTSRS